MTLSFLLRFEEQCRTTSEMVATGTETTTQVMREQPDADPRTVGYRSLPLVDLYAGTRTNTRIGGEQGDADYDSATRTVPLHQTMGTQTATAVKMETDDQDPRQAELTVLPKCSSS